MTQKEAAITNRKSRREAIGASPKRDAMTATVYESAPNRTEVPG